MGRFIKIMKKCTLNKNNYLKKWSLKTQDFIYKSTNRIANTCNIDFKLDFSLITIYIYFLFRGEVDIFL